MCVCVGGEGGGGWWQGGVEDINILGARYSVFFVFLSATLSAR